MVHPYTEVPTLRKKSYNPLYYLVCLSLWHLPLPVPLSFTRHTGLLSASETLQVHSHCSMPLPRMYLHQFLAWSRPPLQSHLCSNVISSQGPNLTTLPPPSSDFPCSYPAFVSGIPKLYIFICLHVYYLCLLFLSPMKSGPSCILFTIISSSSIVFTNSWC